MFQAGSFALALLAVRACFAKPVADHRGSLTILSNNDLENEPSPGSAAILIDLPTDQLGAVKACDQLSETLWVSTGDGSRNSLAKSLAYQVYQRNYKENALFWIAKDKSSCQCQAIGVDGSIQEVKCSKRLPVLCSQSAPVSNATYEDKSPALHVTQQVGKAHFTGYRDFFAWKFLGIRFAPTPQRFEYSTTLRNVSGPVSALEPGADCLQPNSPDSSDDCLFLNIWTPFLPSSPKAKTSAKPALKPVLLYIYGGNFQTGSGKNPYLDLTNIASRGDVVAVTINHRVGNFGMLVLNDGKHNGNIALNDQISALNWIAENIAAFGGDPDRVTIAGESSGAVSCRLLMTSPEAQGLYAGALLQSDGNGGLIEPFGRFWSKQQSYETFTKPILGMVGCDNVDDEVACLRDVPGQQLANLPLLANSPVVDGKYLLTSVFPLDGSGPRYAKDIPLMTGITRDEAALFEIFQGIDWRGVTFEMWEGIIRLNADVFKTDAQTVIDNLAVFGASRESTGLELYNLTINVVTHNVYTCLDQAQAYSGAKNDVFEKVYAFNFHRTYSPPHHTQCQAPVTPDFPFGDPSQPYYRCHGGSHIPMFGNSERNGMPDRDGLDLDFSRLIVDYWSSFVRTGDPNPDKGYLSARGYKSSLAQVKEVGKWKKVNPKAPEWMILEWDGYMTPFNESAACDVLEQPLDFWDTLGVPS